MNQSFSIIAAAVVIILSSCRSHEVSPRAMNGKTYLRTADSVYFISFTIDSVIEMEYEPENKP